MGLQFIQRLFKPQSNRMSGGQNLPFQTMYTEMDESFKINNRWPSGPSDEGAQNVFTRYASGGNEYSRQQVEGTRGGGETQKRFVSEVSYTTNYGDKFKKMKFNQMETLKELRQEYEILRSLPMQDDFLGHSHLKKENISGYSSSQHQAEPDSISSSSKQTDKRKQRNSSNSHRDTQVLTLQKRQLELVIGNSMRKIEELLNNEIEYKKTIHELQLQLDSRSTDDKVENMAKTLKKSESQFNERIENLKRDIERLKQINMQLQNKNEALEAELLSRNQELRKCRDESRILEDSIRLERDKYLNLEIEVKRLKMESDIMEKDKNNEITRLKNLLETQSREPASNTHEVRRLEEDLRSQKHKYEMLIVEFDKYKREVSNSPPKVVVDNRQNEEQLRLFETLINHLREESSNQNRASIDLISSMVAKIEDKNEREREREKQRESLREKERELLRERERQKEREREREREREKERRENLKRKESQKSPKANEDANRLLEELFQLRNEVSTLKVQKEDLNKSTPLINLAESMADYQSKIRKLEQEIADGSISKERLMKEYEVVKSTLEYAREELDRVNEECQRLRERVKQAEQHGHVSSEQVKSQYREKETQNEETIRQLRRQLDEALFMVDKAKKEGEFNAELIRQENEANIKLIRDQLARVEGEKQLLRTELNKMKAFYESKVQEKNVLIEKTAQEFAVACETKEKAFATYKAKNEQDMNELVRKLEGLAEMNDRYLKQSSKLASTEREVSELRYALRRMKGMNDGLDHLWQVKETEYYNVNDILKQLHTQ